MMDMWLFVPFTLGFFFFRSKAGLVTEAARGCGATVAEVLSSRKLVYCTTN